MRYRILLSLTFLWVLAGCSAEFAASGGAGAADSSRGAAAAPVAATPAATAVNDVPALEAVSLSSMSAEAVAALSACGSAGADTVGGMAFVPRARDVPLYVPLWGTEPELQSDRPAWVVAMDGKVEFARGYWAIDPICVVVDEVPTIFAPSGYGRGDHASAPVASPPVPRGVLPPLLP